MEAEPRKGPLDDPPLRNHLETARVIAALDDLHAQPTALTKARDPFNQGARVSSIGPEQSKPHERVSEHRDDETCAVAVLNVASVYDDGDDEPERVDDQVPLATLDFLARIVTARAPREVVFTDWLSMIAADGIRSRPSLSRTSPRSFS